MAYKFYQIDGNDETTTGPSKHRLVIETEPNMPAAGWIARAVGFQETTRVTRHVVRHDGVDVGAPTMKVAWWYPSVKEDRNYLPGTSQRKYPFAVLLDLALVRTGVQLDAQNGPDGPSYRMWVEGVYQGKPIASEVVALGVIDNHITLDVEWALEQVGGVTPPPVVPPPFGGTIAEELTKIEQATYNIRQLLVR